MNPLNIQRLLFLFLFLVTIVSEISFLLIYELLFYLSFEYLNSNSNYLKIKSHKFYNWLFLSFLGFIIFVRIDIFNFTNIIDYHLNSLEHLFFAFVICLTLYVYMQIFNLISSKFYLNLLVVFVAFNGIGFLNEYFQNFYQQKPIFYLEETNIKDIIINVIGSSLVVILSLFYKFKN